MFAQGINDPNQFAENISQATAGSKVLKVYVVALMEILGNLAGKNNEISIVDVRELAPLVIQQIQDALDDVKPLGRASYRKAAPKKRVTPSKSTYTPPNRERSVQQAESNGGWILTGIVVVILGLVIAVLNS